MNRYQLAKIFVYKFCLISFFGLSHLSQAENYIFAYTDDHLTAHVSNVVGNGTLPIAGAIVSADGTSGKTNAAGNTKFTFTDEYEVLYGYSTYDFVPVCANAFDFFQSCVTLDVFINGYGYWDQSDNVVLPMNSVSNFLRGLYPRAWHAPLSSSPGDLAYYQKIVAKGNVSIRNVTMAVLDTNPGRTVRAQIFLNYPFGIVPDPGLISRMLATYVRDKNLEDENVYKQVLANHGLNPNLIYSAAYEEYLIQTLSIQYLGRPVSGQKELNERLAALKDGERNLIASITTSAEFLQKYYP